MTPQALRAQADILRDAAQATHQSADKARLIDTSHPLYDHRVRKARILDLLAAEYEMAVDELESLARSEEDADVLAASA